MAPNSDSITALSLVNLAASLTSSSSSPRSILTFSAAASLSCFFLSLAFAVLLLGACFKSAKAVSNSFLAVATSLSASSLLLSLVLSSLRFLVISEDFSFLSVNSLYFFSTSDSDRRLSSSVLISFFKLAILSLASLICSAFFGSVTSIEANSASVSANSFSIATFFGSSSVFANFASVSANSFFLSAIAGSTLLLGPYFAVIISLTSSSDLPSSPNLAISS